MIRVSERVKIIASNFRHAFTNRRAFLAYIRTDHLANADASGCDPRWSNRDLLPSPPEHCNWNWFNFFTFFFGLSLANWPLGSSMIGIGLNWWQSIIVIFFASMISSIATWYNSRSATTYHIGYPAVARSVFGMWGSFYVVGARAALAIIWYGIQLYQGSSYVVNILHAIFGHSFTSVPNGISTSMGFTTQQMIAFLIFWTIHTPFIFLRPYQLRHFFTAKAFIGFVACTGLFIYSMAATKGNLGPLFSAKRSGSNLGWLVVWCVNSAMGNTATLITNQPDLARWGKTNNSPMVGVLFAYPLATVLTSSFGILSTAAINHAWGLELWNPWDLMTEILNRHWRGDVRFAVLVCASGWAVNALATNIGCNMIPFGADAALLWPRYLTITRGQVIVHLLGFAICPWKIMTSASVFLTFLSGYGIFMGPVVAIMICEYFVVSHGNIFIPSLYVGSKNNDHYWFHGGWNIQAYTAYLAAIAVVFPGFVGSLGANVPIEALHLGRIGWCLSFVLGFLVYWVLSIGWPHRNVQATKGLEREELAKQEFVTLIVDGLGRNQDHKLSSEVKVNDISRSEEDV